MKYSLPAIAVLVVATDRILKWYAQSLPDQGTAFSLVPGIDFGHYINPALFFFPAWHWIPWVALGVLIVIGILLVINPKSQILNTKQTQNNNDPKQKRLEFRAWNLFRISKLEIRNSPSQTLLFLLLGGASNVFDRFFYGGVIDYFTFLYRATWNLADVLIGIGIILFFFNRKTARK